MSAGRPRQTMRHREEVINTQLAVLISKLGVSADAETIQLRGTHRPDVLFRLRGLRVVIEGKFADASDAEGHVLDDARQRVRAGVAHLAAATVYPDRLRRVPTSELLDALAAARLRYAIVTETAEPGGWFEGTPAALMEALRRAQEALARDDIVETTAKALHARLVSVAQLWAGQTGACDRLSGILGITPPRGESPDKAEARRETAAKVSALVLANALIFQEQLAQTDAHVHPLRKVENDPDVVSALAAHWRWIWEHINYVPIFQLGERVLNELPTAPGTTAAVGSVLEQAKAICVHQAALRHDLMGRIYHWLLHEAKYLGTYYTSVPAATLLLKLTLAAHWPHDFGDPAALARFKVADLACGTGTLLMAAAQAFSDVYVRTRAASERPLDQPALSALHRALMEDMVHGYDVLPTAVHLTASTLALLAPDVAFARMNLFVMPLGMDKGEPRLGSLDFIGERQVQNQFALDHAHAAVTRIGAATEGVALAELPKLHLCVMNPPFVRSVGGNLLFGSLPDAERKALQTALKKRTKPLSASVTAGLGSVFVALADKHLEAGGRLAFVLPAALASGEAWGPTRKLLADGYHLETVVSSHDAERPNFSENTNLSELLFIARKLGSGEKPGRTTYISLWRNPRSIHEAMYLANEIEQVGSVVGIEESGLTDAGTGDAKLAELMTLPAAVDDGIWLGALFAQVELLRVAWHLENGHLWLPGSTRKTPLLICELRALGPLGPDRKRIHEGFKVSQSDWSPFPGFWGHNAKEVVTIAQTPNCRLLEWKDSPRGPHYGSHLWQRAGRILLVERLWPITHTVLAVGFENKILGNTWWALDDSRLSERERKALILWLNSTLSLLCYYGRRTVTRSAWMQMKQPAWASMPVLDVRSLSAAQTTAFADAYDNVASKALAPLAQLDADPVRHEIDDVICAALHLPSLAPVRALLAREPGLTARKIGSGPADSK